MKKFASVILVSIIGYIVAAFLIWQINNPKANQMTFYTHFVDMIELHELPEFQ